MNNFNNVFLAIKKYCDENGEIKEAGCFEKIAREAGVAPDKIEFFLNILKDLQLIKYSVKDQHIRLTSFGRKQERLFSD